jgi:hypothetical protein
MKLGNTAAVGQPLGQQVDFALQEFQIRRGLLFVGANDHVTATKETTMITEGKMYVDGERIVPKLVRGGKTIMIVYELDSLVEFDCGRIARVSRAWPIVPGQEFGSNLGWHFRNLLPFRPAACLGPCRGQQ